MTSNPGGTGDAVSDGVDYSPWLTIGGTDSYNDGTGTSVESSNGDAEVDFPAGIGSLIDTVLSIAVIDKPTSLAGDATPGSVFVVVTPSIDDFGPDPSTWPTLTLRRTGSGSYVPQYFDGTAWVPYASTDYADETGNLGHVSSVGDNVVFKVKHTTPIGGGGNPGTGLNLYIMILSAATLLIIGTLLIFTKPGQRIELTV